MDVNLNGASLTTADLRSVVIENAKARNAVFNNANLHLGWMDGDFVEATFDAATLHDAILIGDFRRVSFKKTDMQGCWLREVNLGGADLTGANLLNSTNDLVEMDLKITLPDGTKYLPITNDMLPFSRPDRYSSKD